MVTENQVGVKQVRTDHTGSCKPLQRPIHLRGEKLGLGIEGTLYEEVLKGITVNGKSKIMELSSEVVGIIQKKCDAL